MCQDEWKYYNIANCALGIRNKLHMLEFKVKYIQENCVNKVVGKFAEIADNSCLS